MTFRQSVLIGKPFLTNSNPGWNRTGSKDLISVVDVGEYIETLLSIKLLDRQCV